MRKGKKDTQGFGAPLVIVAVAIVILAALVGYWYWQKGQGVPVPNVTAPVTTPSTSTSTSTQGKQVVVPEEEVEESLGGEIFQKVSNPVVNELPNTNVTPVTNPIGEIYNNPFE